MLESTQDHMSMEKKSACMGRTLNGVFQAKNRQNLAYIGLYNFDVF